MCVRCQQSAWPYQKLEASICDCIICWLYHQFQHHHCTKSVGVAANVTPVAAVAAMCIGNAHNTLELE
jgi:hypothetical protein